MSSNSNDLSPILNKGLIEEKYDYLNFIIRVLLKDKDTTNSDQLIELILRIGINRAAGYLQSIKFSDEAKFKSVRTVRSAFKRIFI